MNGGSITATVKLDLNTVFMALIRWVTNFRRIFFSLAYLHGILSLASQTRSQGF